MAFVLRNLGAKGLAATFLLPSLADQTQIPTQLALIFSKILSVFVTKIINIITLNLGNFTMSKNYFLPVISIIPIIKYWFSISVHFRMKTPACRCTTASHNNRYLLTENERTLSKIVISFEIISSFIRWQGARWDTELSFVPYEMESGGRLVAFKLGLCRLLVFAESNILRCLVRADPCQTAVIYHIM